MKFSPLIVKGAVALVGFAGLSTALPLLNDTTGLDFYELGGGNFTTAESVKFKHCKRW